MSSIYGLHFFGGRPADSGRLVQMETALNHWNADDRGIAVNETTGFGHLMLYNTPESLQEKLPFSDPISRLLITADARLDNRDELLAKLNLNGQILTDSYLILKAYQKYGKNCIHHLIGDFAFVILDKDRRELFCARDQMGIKPLFYYQDQNCFAFASEKKGILCLDGIDQTIDRRFFYQHLFWPGEQLIGSTLYKNIKRLPPACTLSLDEISGKTVLERYWDLDTQREISLGSIAEYDELLRYHFAEAVKCRTRSAFPVGAELSGGMDSSGIVGAAQSMLSGDQGSLITFTHTLPLQTAGNFPGITIQHRNLQAVVNFNEIKEAVHITASLWDNLDDELEFALYADDGFERIYDIGNAALKQAAMQRGVRTLLSGCGGDNMVTNKGRNYYFDLLEKKRYRAYWNAQQQSGSKINKLKPFVPNKLIQLNRTMRDLVGSYKPDIQLGSSIFNIPRDIKLKHKETMYSRIGYDQLYDNYRSHLNFHLMRPSLSQRMESETRLGYYYRLEPRYPMLDIRLLQYFLSIPNELKYEGPMSRMIYRRAVKPWLPDELYNYDSKSEPFRPIFPDDQIKRYGQISKILKTSPAFLFKDRAGLINRIELGIKNKEWTNAYSSPRWLWPVLSNTILFKWLQENQNAIDYLK
jgi:asparagine synthase (glutamine-hydrolysing)